MKRHKSNVVCGTDKVRPQCDKRNAALKDQKKTVTYIAIGAAVIGLGVLGYRYFRKIQKCNQENHEPDENQSDAIISKAKESLKNIENQQEIISEDIKNTVEEIKVAENDAKQRMEELNEVIKELEKDT